MILIFAVAIIGYGTWLNKSDENKIADRMENRTIPLQGTKVVVREIHPKIILPTINLYSEEMADAVALIDGRIENLFIAEFELI